LLDKLAKGIAMFAVPSKLTPAIVLDVWSLVAEATLELMNANSLQLPHPVV
jgi:hypothetical protein